MPRTTLVCNISEINLGLGTGQYRIQDLKALTKNTGMRVVIRGYGQIVDGELKVFKVVH